jgi:hypothetical protein
VINEVQPQGSTDGFIELFNCSPEPMDLSQWILTDTIETNRFRIPMQTVLAPGAFLTIESSSLGFFPSELGGALFLMDPNQTFLADAFVFGPITPGVSYGRHPNGTGSFRTLAYPTRGEPNSWLCVGPVVINELMYAPISGDPADEYVELYNWSSERVDLSGWELNDGVSFAFPVGTTIGAGAYLVVAKDPARLYATHSCVSSTQIYGPFTGSLANRGERIRLSKPAAAVGRMIVVDEVAYGTGGRWGKWAHGGGTSLELIHPLTDHQSPTSWTDSNESSKAAWTTIEFAGCVTNYGASVGVPNGVNVVLLGAGECLLQNVEVINENQVNVVSNGTFQAGLAGWSGQATTAELSWLTMTNHRC